VPGLVEADSVGLGGRHLVAPAVADAGQLRDRLLAGEWVVDLRDRAAFAAGHLPGSLFFGMDGAFAPQLGRLMPLGTPLTLLGAGVEQVAAARRELARIGVDRVVAHAVGDPAAWAGGAGLASFVRVGFADLATARRHRPVVVVDVRSRRERAGGRLGGAVGIALDELPGRVGEMPHGDVWVHCSDGYRAMIAASLLASVGGRQVIVVDDTFDPAALSQMPELAPLLGVGDGS
jgi:hydroxyacylglutathione hydrolase